MDGVNLKTIMQIVHGMVVIAVSLLVQMVHIVVIHMVDVMVIV